jgi:hypothetical protein
VSVPAQALPKSLFVVDEVGGALALLFVGDLFLQGFAANTLGTDRTEQAQRRLAAQQAYRSRSDSVVGHDSTLGAALPFPACGRRRATASSLTLFDATKKARVARIARFELTRFELNNL